MNLQSARAWLGTLIRLGLAAIWVWAGWSKLTDPNEFVRAVRAYDATPEWLSQAIGYGLPVLELMLALLLLLGLVTRAAAAVSGLLFAVFLVGLIQAAARGIKLDCGCFGGGGATDGATTYTLDILRDVGLLVLAVYLVLWPITKLSVDSYLGRNDTVPLPSAKRMRTEAGQKKYNAMLAARKKQAQSRSVYLLSGIGVVVLLVGIIGIGVQAKRADVAGQLTATNASVVTGVTVGQASAPAKVVAYEDFQCPVCNNFEQTVGGKLSALVAAGKVQIQYHPVGFLDRSSNGNQYSSRASNAAICASDYSVEFFQQYHAYLYGKVDGTDVQPAEGTDGRTDADLIGYFAKAVPTATDEQKTGFTACVTGDNHKAFVQKLTDNASKKGINSIPTVFLNGQELKTPVTDLLPAIAELGIDTNVTPSPTPTGSATSTPTGSATATPSPTSSPSAAS
ncbi:MauE/DoxX family redox-associated membrane protein [Jatrophihabitans sp. YIM 134969]